MRLERACGPQSQPIHRQTPTHQTARGSGVLADEIGDLGGPASGDLMSAGAREEVCVRRCGADLVDDFRMRIQELAIGELEYDDGTVGVHHGEADRVVHRPQRHVGRVGGITDVDRVVQQCYVAVRIAQLFADSLQPVPAQGGSIRQLEPRSHPLCLQLCPWAERVHVQLRVVQQPFGRLGSGNADLGSVTSGKPRMLHG